MATGQPLQPRSGWDRSIEHHMLDHMLDHMLEAITIRPNSFINHGSWSINSIIYSPNRASKVKLPSRQIPSAMSFG